MTVSHSNELDKYLTSNDKTWRDGPTLVYSPPDTGKTFFLATASAQFPAVVPSPEPVTLEDTVWVSADPGATAGLRASNILVDEVDFLGLLGDLGVIKAMDAVPKILRGLKSSRPKLRRFAIDTITAVDKYLRAYFDENCPTGRDGGRDTIAMNGRILAYHTRFHTALLGTGLQPMYAAHSKSMEGFVPLKGEAAVTDQRRKAATGASLVEPDISGQALTLYRGACSLAFITKRLTEKGKPDRYVAMLSVPDWDTKNRFRTSIPATNEAHLGRIMEQVAASMGKTNKEGQAA